jgi:hypothetical protein
MCALRSCSPRDLKPPSFHNPPRVPKILSVPYPTSLLCSWRKRWGALSEARGRMTRVWSLVEVETINQKSHSYDYDGPTWTDIVWSLFIKSSCFPLHDVCLVSLLLLWIQDATFPWCATRLKYFCLPNFPVCALIFLWTTMCFSWGSKENCRTCSLVELERIKQYPGILSLRRGSRQTAAMQVSWLFQDTSTFSRHDMHLFSFLSHDFKSQPFHSPPRLRIPTMFASQSNFYALLFL